MCQFNELRPLFLSIVTDNFLIRVKGDGLTLAGFQAAYEKLRQPEFWDSEGLWKQITAALPSYRLSKFQPLMPDWIEQEVIAEYLLDVSGAKKWLKRGRPLQSQEPMNSKRLENRQ